MRKREKRRELEQLKVGSGNLWKETFGAGFEFMEKKHEQSGQFRDCSLSNKKKGGDRR